MPTDVSAEDWREIERLVDDLSALAAAQPSLVEFYARLLQDALTALAAQGGAVWLFDGDGRLQLEYQINLAGLALAGEPQEEAHNQLLRRSLRDRRVLFAPPGAGGRDPQGTNPTPCLLAFAPIVLENRLLGAVEIFHAQDLSPAARRGAGQLLTAIAEVAADYHHRSQLRTIQADAGFHREVERFALRVRDSLQPREVAYETANELRRILGCDRVSVAAGGAGRPLRLLAVSGVDDLDQRADAVRRLQELVDYVAASSEPLHASGDRPGSSPEAAALIDAYFDAAHVREFAVLPLREAELEDAEEAPPGAASAPGVVVLESFRDAWDACLLPRARRLLPHAAAALRQAEDYHSLPLLRLSQGLRSLTWLVGPGGWPRGAAVAALLVAAVLAGALIPADLTISVRGRLQPAIRAEVYAPQDGVVESSLAHDDRVVAGDVVATLSNSSLSLEKERVRTRSETARSRLGSISIALLEGPPDDAEERTWRAGLAAEREELEQLLESLELQQRILDEQLQSLVVRAPLGGVVLTWEAEQMLRRRPVRRGQLLMSVGDPAGPWNLELEAPDYYIGHLLKARQTRQEPLPVTFVLGADPGLVRRAQVVEVAASTTGRLDDRPVVRVLAEVDDAQREGLRPGATVLASVRCSRVPLIYAWLHDLIDVVRGKLWW